MRASKPKGPISSGSRDRIPAKGPHIEQATTASMNRNPKACFLSFFLLLSVLALSLSLFAQNPQQRQNTARAALQSEMVQEGKDCPDAKSQFALNICIE